MATRKRGSPRGPSAAPADESAPHGEFVLYETEDGRTRVECRFEEHTLWLSQALMAELFQKDVRTVNEHLLNIFDEAELDPQRTIRKFRIVRLEGERQVARLVDHYNLDAILAVGYRVRSTRGTQFRRWATERLREYLVKGFTLDDERLKHPSTPGTGPADYFDELLERIRDIRASEARMYLRVKELFALAADYDPAATEVTRFFQVMQNKLHFAATGQTAAELIAGRADAEAPNMGLTTWKGGRAQGRRHRREELPERDRDRRTEPHRGDVPGLRRRPRHPALPDVRTHAPPRSTPRRSGRPARPRPRH